MMQEVVVISGKGGTGKTSLVACFASLAGNAVIADCDVDAADLHLVLGPRVKHREPFRGGRQASIKDEDCVRCGICKGVCRFDAVRIREDERTGSDIYSIDPISCEGCAVCFHACPSDAIELEEVINGEWFISDTKFGPMVHARLGVAQENSGKLVTLVRNEARQIAEHQHLDLIVADGSPGIGCPVISSITGADMVVTITEPTLSGEHDLKRVSELASHFGIPSLVCINKYDLNEEMSFAIEDWCSKEGLPVAGRVPYDNDFTRAQVAGKPLTEYSDGLAAAEVKRIWKKVLERLAVLESHRLAESIGSNSMSGG
jgi:MinD superfamily P-loop ATPase